MKQQTPEILEQTYSHFKDGYRNAQEVVRFIDTKTGVLTGLLGLTTAFPFVVFKWATGLGDNSKFNFNVIQTTHQISNEILMAGFVAGILFGLIGMVSGVEGICPRPPRKYYHEFLGFLLRLKDIVQGKHKKKNDKPPITVLFPYYESKHEVEAKKLFNKSAKGLEKKSIIREYEMQVGQVGRILAIKMKYNQRAAMCFKIQILSYLIGIIFSSVAAFVYDI